MNNVHERVLDLSTLSEEDYLKILKGWNDFANPSNSRVRYFGYVDKTEIKKLAKVFGYKTISYSTITFLITMALAYFGVKKS